MKTKKSLSKLALNKSTVANLTLGKMRAVRGGEPPITEGWATCACLTYTCPETEPITDGCNFTFPDCIDTGSSSVLSVC